MEAVRCLLCLSQVLRPRNVSWPLRVCFFGCDIGLKLAQNRILPFLQWKEDKVRFSDRVNGPHELLDVEAVHCL